jgi:hypothetical protein
VSVPSQLILRKLECLRLITKSIPLESVVSQLVQDGVFTKKFIEEKLSGKRSAEQEDALLIALENASKENGTIGLLHYEWEILPDLRAKISVLTPAGMREFEYIG